MTDRFDYDVWRSSMLMNGAVIVMEVPSLTPFPPSISLFSLARCRRALGPRRASAAAVHLLAHVASLGFFFFSILVLFSARF